MGPSDCTINKYGKLVRMTWNFQSWEIGTFFGLHGLISPTVSFGSLWPFSRMPAFSLSGAILPAKQSRHSAQAVGVLESVSTSKPSHGELIRWRERE